MGKLINISGSRGPATGPQGLISTRIYCRSETAPVRQRSYKCLKVVETSIVLPAFTLDLSRPSDHDEEFTVCSAARSYRFDDSESLRR
jgi:hypothetical protein